MTFRLVTKRVIIYETIAFGIVLAFLWADELFDLPHNIFGTEATPINWTESLVESGFVVILAGATIFLSNYYLHQIKQLEGILPVCAVCKKIKENNDWVPFEEYVKEHSAADFTHGLCPECAKPYFDELEQISEPTLDQRD
ncbi:MAG: hypothetical protein HZB44_05195 [Actinobacteria bacterium]|nr:hypothetical protein [Actinomycetota bacterium]